MAYVADNIVGSQKYSFTPYPVCFPEEYKKTIQRYIDLEISTFLVAHHGKLILSKQDLLRIIQISPNKRRSHRNSLVIIFIKLIKSLLRKIKFFR